MKEERRAYHIKNYYLRSVEKFFTKFNFKTKEELRIKKLQYDHRGASEKFKKIVTINRAIVTMEEGEYVWKDMM